MAASSAGGRAVAAHSQATFDAELAIDGKEESARGWAYHGNLDLAAIAFAFDQPSLISRIMIVSGKGLPDHRIVTLRLYYYPAVLTPHGEQVEAAEDEELFEAALEPSSWTYDLGGRWRPVEALAAAGGVADINSIVTLGHVVYAVTDRLVPQGQERMELQMRPTAARAIAMRIERTDAPHANGLLNEFLAFGRPLSPGEADARRRQESAVVYAAEAADLRFGSLCLYMRTSGVPSELAANCSGSRRYEQANAKVCEGAIVLTHRACNGKVGIHFVESWSRDHISSVLRALRRRLHEASAVGSDVYVIDGSGLHFIAGGRGLRAGFDGYLSEILSTIQRFREQELLGAGVLGARVVLVKSLIEPYSFAGNRNVLNNWNIASMNLAAREALMQHEVKDEIYTFNTWPLVGAKSADCSFDGVHYNEGLNLFKAEVLLAFLAYTRVHGAGQCNTTATTYSF